MCVCVCVLLLQLLFVVLWRAVGGGDGGVEKECVIDTNDARE